MLSSDLRQCKISQDYQQEQAILGNIHGKSLRQLLVADANANIPLNVLVRQLSFRSSEEPMTAIYKEITAYDNTQKYISKHER